MVYEQHEEETIIHDPEENYLTGYIKVYRSIRSHWIWQDAEKFKWWLDIMLEVNHTDKKVLLGGSIIECKRGQSLNSLETWAKQWKVDEGKVRRFFKLLEADSMIKTENVKKTTRLTVCNYVSYNDRRHADDTGATRKRHEGDTGATPNNNVNKLKNDNKLKREARAKDFYDSLKPFLQTYKPKMLRDFYEYWIEPNKSQTKMRFELETTWDTARRLSTWASREDEFTRTNKTEKQKEQERELMKSIGL